MMSKHIFVWKPERTTVYYNNITTSLPAETPLDQLKDIGYRAAGIIREKWILVFITEQ
jgi:hypothetical protein